jgi:hypothetical protein
MLISLGSPHERGAGRRGRASKASNARAAQGLSSGMRGARHDSGQALMGAGGLRLRSPLCRRLVSRAWRRAREGMTSGAEREGAGKWEHGPSCALQWCTKKPRSALMSVRGYARALLGPLGAQRVTTPPPSLWHQTTTLRLAVGQPLFR